MAHHITRLVFDCSHRGHGVSGVSGSKTPLFPLCFRCLFRSSAAATVVSGPMLASLASSHLGIPTRDAAVLAAPYKLRPSPSPQSSRLPPLPVISLGLPRSASPAVLDFFQCNGMKTSHYNCVGNCTGTKKDTEFCGDSETAGKCGECVSDNIQDGRPPFDGCGDYDVWTQFDGSWDVDTGDAVCFLPQITELHALHATYPDATLLLATRRPDLWVKSVGPKLRDAFGACKFTACKADCVADDKQFAAFYEEHTRTIREWVERHPSHKLIEIDADLDATSKVLADATGLSGSCWGPTKCSGSCEYWQEVRVNRLRDAADAAAAALEHEQQVTKDAKCQDEPCAKEHRIAEQKMLSAKEHAAEALRQAEDQIHSRDAEKERLKEAATLEKDRAAEAEAQAKRQSIDNSKTDVGEKASTPANSHDPNVVCIPLEGYDENWCYAACPTGLCPSDAKKGCMCAAGNGVAGDGEQQQGVTDWATGKKLPSSRGTQANTACVAIKAGYSDFWCQSTCRALVGGVCPTEHELCSCAEGAAEKAKAAQAKVMEEWEEAQRKHREAEGQRAPAVAAVPAAPGPATPEQTKAAADAWEAAAAAKAPEPVVAQPTAAAAAPVAAQPADAAASDEQDATAATAAAAEAWKAAAAAPAPVAVSVEPEVAAATTVAATATAKAAATAAAAAAAPAKLAGFLRF